MPRVIAGLGNPGRQYADTRHNVGWLALDRAAQLRRVQGEQYACGGVYVSGGGLWLFKPLRYMNRSGPPVAQACRAAGAELHELLVVVDDFNLPLGRIRLRRGGSSGGHNGLRSVAQALGTEEFPRLRMGIGPGGPVEDAFGFVLSPFEDDEWDAVEQMADRAARAALCWADEGVEAAMAQYNGQPNTQQDA